MPIHAGIRSRTADSRRTSSTVYYRARLTFPVAWWNENPRDGERTVAATGSQPEGSAPLSTLSCIKMKASDSKRMRYFSEIDSHSKPANAPWTIP